MSWFSDPSSFDPSRDSKMTVRRGPFWLIVRGVAVLASLLCSRHPADAWVWMRSMKARRRPLSMALPWLTFDAIRVIRRQLRDKPRIFEFGSGHSTLYWLEIGASVVSVEDDSGWYVLLRDAINVRGHKDCTLVHAPTISSYVGAISAFAFDSFDLVLVDGAHRRDCVIAAVPYVKPGGLLVVDNTDWHWFLTAPIEGVPKSWTRVRYPGYGPMIGHRSETSVWQRPVRE